MASVEKYTKKDGKEAWLVRYATYENGRRRQHMQRGFAKQRDAKAFASRVEHQINSQQYVSKSDVTLREYIDFYLELYCTDLAPKTIECYTGIGKRLKRTALADRPLQKITTEDLQLLLRQFMTEPRSATMTPPEDGKRRQREDQPLSANSALHYLRFLNLVFARAVLNKKILYNPCATVAKPKPGKHKHVILDPEEYSRLLTSVKDTPIYIPILLGGFMGLRREEVLGLTWPDVDFKEQVIRIRQTRQVVNGVEVVGDPKTEKSRRVLYMPAFVCAALKEHKNRIVIDISHQFVCSVSTGEPLSINTFNRRFKRALQAAGLPEHVRFHDLRHSAAALLTQAGANPKEVSEYLGHANIGITMDLYADVFEQSKKETAARMDALFEPHLKG